MTWLWRSDIALLVVLNLGLAALVGGIAAPFHYDLHVRDWEALHHFRNIIFPFTAAFIYAHIHFGYHRPRWRWLWYLMALLNFLSYAWLGAKGPLLNGLYYLLTWLF